MKAVILTAGKGLRLMPITSSRPKPMIPLAGKPILEHTILGLKEAGIREILLIVGYKEKMIMNYFNKVQETLNIKIEYIKQSEQLGTGHAASLAKTFVKNESFLLMYGDLMIDKIIFKEIIERYIKSKLEGLISLIEVDNPQNFGIISLKSDGFVNKIVEKPSPDLNLGNLANAGIYIFSPLIFEAINKTEKSIRGEYEFTDSMQILINQLNGRILGYNIKDCYWSDIGLPWQLLEANNYFLEKIEGKILGEIEDNVLIIGRDDHEVEVGQLLYEFIVLALPYQRIHPDDAEGKSACNVEMLNRLNAHRIEGPEGKEETDPRWDVLKGIIEKNK